MSCAFENTLHYSSPAHGGWGIVRIGMLVPESVQLFVCPFACGRHGAIGIMKQSLKHRLSYLYVDQSDIITGYDHLIPPAIGELLETLPQRPRVILIFVSCLDDLIGTDNDALQETLEQEYPDIRFRVCHMNPISLNSKTPPGVSTQNNLYSLLDPSAEKDNGVNCLGNLVKVSPDSEIHAFLHHLQLGTLRHISQYDSFDGYQEMGRSRLNLVIAPPAKKAADSMEKKLGIPSLFAPVSYRMEEVEASYQAIADCIGTDPGTPFDFTPHVEATRAAIQRAREKVGNTPIIVDSSAFVRPFDAARALLEYGFHVVRVQAEDCIPFDQPHFDWLQAEHPEVEILQSNHHRAVLFDHKIPESIAVGVDGAYLAGSKYAADLFNDEGMFGYHGIQSLMGLLEHALDQPVDLEKLILDYGLVV